MKVTFAALIALAACASAVPVFPRPVMTVPVEQVITDVTAVKPLRQDTASPPEPAGTYTAVQGVVSDKKPVPKVGSNGGAVPSADEAGDEAAIPATTGTKTPVPKTGGGQGAAVPNTPVPKTGGQGAVTPKPSTGAGAPAPDANGDAATAPAAGGAQAPASGKPVNSKAPVAGGAAGTKPPAAGGAAAPGADGDAAADGAQAPAAGKPTGTKTPVSGGSATGAASEPIGTEANEFKEGPCREVTLLWARGSGQDGNMGQAPGPDLANALKAKLGASKVAVQGMSYSALLIGNLASSGAMGMEESDFLDLINDVAVKCPASRLVVAGYSQGAALLHGALSAAPAALQTHIAAAVTFGDTRRQQEGGRIRNFDPRRTLIICNDGDAVCDGTLLITPAHSEYQARVPEAVSFIASHI